MAGACPAQVGAPPPRPTRTPRGSLAQVELPRAPGGGGSAGGAKRRGGGGGGGKEGGGGEAPMDVDGAEARGDGGEAPLDFSSLQQRHKQVCVWGWRGGRSRHCMCKASEQGTFYW